MVLKFLVYFSEDLRPFGDRHHGSPSPPPVRAITTAVPLYHYTALPSGLAGVLQNLSGSSKMPQRPFRALKFHSFDGKGAPAPHETSLNFILIN